MAFLSKSLSRAGYAVLPAITSETANSLLEELKTPKVDLLVVNLILASTADLATVLKEKNQSLKIIAIQDPRLRVITKVPVHARLRKPSPDELKAEENWLGTARRVLSDK